MSSTPEPASPSSPSQNRVVTPSAPRYGTLLDSWDPYPALRRSTRIAEKHTDLDGAPVTPPRQRNITPTPRHSSRRLFHSPGLTDQVSTNPGSDLHVSKRKLGRASGQVHDDSHNIRGNAETEADPFNPKLTHQPLGSDTDTSSPFLTSWPTPSKTPSKYHSALDFAPASSSRLLFPSPSKFDHILPTRRTPKLNFRAQEDFSLSDDLSAFVSPTKFNVYVDSDQRTNHTIQDRNDDEDNPFVTKPETHAGLNPPPRLKIKTPSFVETEEEKRMREAVHRNEGVIYVFRGKKVFRPFANVGQDPFATSPALTSPTTPSDFLNGIRPSQNVSRLLWPTTSAPKNASIVTSDISLLPLSSLSDRPMRSLPRKRIVSPILLPDQGVSGSLSVIQPPTSSTDPKMNNPDPVTSTPTESTPIKQRQTLLSHFLAIPPRTPRLRLGREAEAHEPGTSKESERESDLFAPAIAPDALSIITDSHQRPRSPFDSWRRVKSPTKSSALASGKALPKIADSVSSQPRGLKRSADPLDGPRKRLRS